LIIAVGAEAHTDAQSLSTSAGFYKSSWGEHPKVQVVTVGELLDGRRLDTAPLHQADRTFRKAPRASEGHEALQLDVD